MIIDEIIEESKKQIVTEDMVQAFRLRVKKREEGFNKEYLNHNVDKEFLERSYNL